MQIFMTNPEAVYYGPDQAWLSPQEAVEPVMVTREVYRARLTERAAALRNLLRKVEDELHYLGRA